MRIVHPEFGDMTADVAAELALMRQEEERRAFEQAAARQRRIAASGQEAGTLKCGHMVAQIDASVFDYWQRREGRGFWADKSNLRYMLKRHPELRVNSKSRRATILRPDLPARPARAATGTILDAHGRSLAAST